MHACTTDHMLPALAALQLFDLSSFGDDAQLLLLRGCGDFAGLSIYLNLCRHLYIYIYIYLYLYR